MSRDKEGNGVGAEEKEPGFRKREAFIEFLPTDRLGWAIPVGANVVAAELALERARGELIDRMRKYSTQ